MLLCFPLTLQPCTLNSGYCRFCWSQHSRLPLSAVHSVVLLGIFPQQPALAACISIISIVLADLGHLPHLRWKYGGGRHIFRRSKPKRGTLSKRRRRHVIISASSVPVRNSTICREKPEWKKLPKVLTA
jgi:hypothetical protein